MFIEKNDVRMEYDKVDKAHKLSYIFNRVEEVVVDSEGNTAGVLVNDNDRTYMYAPTLMHQNDVYWDDIVDYLKDLEENRAKRLIVTLFTKKSKKSGQDYYDYILRVVKE